MYLWNWILRLYRCSWLGSGGKVIAELCSGACTYANNFVSLNEHPQWCMCKGIDWTLSSLLQAELIDVQYGTVEDLIRVQAITNVTKKIALLKLGQSPLLYKVSSSFVGCSYVWGELLGGYVYICSFSSSSGIEHRDGAYWSTCTLDSTHKPHLNSKCQVTAFYCKYFINRNAVLSFRKYTSPINI